MWVWYLNGTQKTTSNKCSNLSEILKSALFLEMIMGSVEVKHIFRHFLFYSLFNLVNITRSLSRKISHVLFTKRVALHCAVSGRTVNKVSITLRQNFCLHSFQRLRYTFVSKIYMNWEGKLVYLLDLYH